MNEEPKSAGKKSWLGLRWPCLWLIIFAASFFVILLIALFQPHDPSNFNSLLALFYIFLLSAIIATVLVIAWACLRWLCCWRNFKRFLFGAACLATLIALFYLEENWRGKHDWDSYKSGLEAQGQKFEFTDYLPPAVPDDQNFAMSPVCIASLVRSFGVERTRTWYGDRIQGDEVAKFLPLVPCNQSAITGTNVQWAVPQAPDISISWPTGGLVNLKPWQAYYRRVAQRSPMPQITLAPQEPSSSADVLQALSKYDPVINRLRRDSQLPGSRFPVQFDIDDPWEILLPHLGVIKGYSSVLYLRVIAELQENQSAAASDDILLMLRVADSVKAEPFAITYLVRIAIMQMAVQGIYEGLSRHQWSDAQLAQMDSALANLDYLADFRRSIASETAAHARATLWLEQKRSRVQAVIDMTTSDTGYKLGRGVAFIVAEHYVMPKGWFYQGDILMVQSAQPWLSDTAVDDAKQIVSPSGVLEVSNAVNKLLLPITAYDFLERILEPEWSTLAQRTAYAQASADLACTAIALERYHLAHGEFPESLDALVPQYLGQVPHDIINGEPLPYRRTAEGQFILYSVGWNGVDDGGQASQPRYFNGTWRDTGTGDWVWQSPQK